MAGQWQHGLGFGLENRLRVRVPRGPAGCLLVFFREPCRWVWGAVVHTTDRLTQGASRKALSCRGSLHRKGDGGRDEESVVPQGPWDRESRGLLTEVFKHPE